ncbi:MAG: amidohydrolase family protein, partial [Alphaproteobacteria bacterium]
AAGVEIIAKAKARGLPITATVCITNLNLNNLDIGEYRTFFKLKPPLRTEDDRLALIEGVRDGVIDCITSNHRPEDPEAKRQPFAQAGWGAIGVETLLPCLLELVHNGSLDMATALKTVTANPADLLGLAQGRLEIGAPADLTLLDPDVPFVLKPEALQSKSKNTPYEDRRLQGRAILTMVAGQTVFEYGA